MDELEVDKSRMVGTGHDATVYFFGAPVIYSPWLEFPLSNERKSGFLTPTTGSTRHPRLRVLRSRTTSISRPTTMRRSRRGS